MKYSRKSVVSVSVLLLLVFVGFGFGVRSAFCAVTSEDAALKIDEADVALRRAFAAVLDAEGVGANVSGLILELGLAGGNLTSAENAYRSGAVVEAVVRADRCVVLANGIVGEASLLKVSALAATRDREWRLFAFSGVGGLVFMLVLVLAWAVFKRSYSRKLLDMKPEVGADA